MTGFERSNEGEWNTTFGTFHQTNDQVSFGSHTEKFAYFGSFNGNRSDYGLETPGPEVLHDRLVTGIAARSRATPAQVVFCFARAIGMLPLTGTSTAEHMKQDLASRELALSGDEVRAIESLSG